jgi:hypothetical protein
MSARPPRRGWISAVLCLVPALLAGCASLKAYPDRSGNMSTELQQLDQYFAATVLQTYASKTTDAEKKTYRDEVVAGRIRAIDLHFGAFQQAVFREGVDTNIVTDLIILGLGAATATTGGVGLKAALGATTTGVAGARTSIDKNLYFEKTMPALVAQMIASRKTVLVRIQEGLDKNVALYPLFQALIDLEDYYNAGSIPGAIAAVTEQAGATAKNADAVMLSVRNKAFFAPERQSRVERLLDRISKLPADRAIALATNLPAQDSETAAILLNADPTGQRTKTETAAKRVMSMLAPYAKKSDTQLDAWEAALTVAERQ